MKIKYLFLVFTFIIFCYQESYETKKSNVTIDVNCESEYPDIINRFSDGLLERLQAFADEKGDFTVCYPSDTGNIKTPTHKIIISVDSIQLLSFVEHSKVINEAYSSNRKQPGSSIGIPIPAITPFGFSPSITIAVRRGFRASKYPSIYATVVIKEISTGEIIWNTSKRILARMSEPSTPRQQLGNMLSILRGLLDNKLPYFQLTTM